MDIPEKDPDAVMLGRLGGRKKRATADPKRTEAQHRYRARNWPKVEAHSLVSRALRLGFMTRGACTRCGDPKTEGHHADYSQPYAVEWLCRKHHRALHKELRGTK